MAAHIRVLAAATALFWAGAASAKVYITVQPRASFVGGYNDNVLLDGTGSDGFGQATPGLKLDILGDHQLHVNLDCQAGLARLVHPEKFGVGGSAFASNETCLTNIRDRVGARTTLHFFGRATYAQDPFAIAGLGLLLRPGQTQIFVANVYGEVAQALSPRSELDLGVGTQMLSFGSGDAGNGWMVAPQARYAYHSSPRTTWDFGFREQLFLGVAADPNPRAPNGAPGGILSYGHAGLVGWTYKLTQSAEVVIRGGPLLINDRTGSVVQPTLRGEIANVTPWSAVRLIVGHDVAIGANTAGPLVADIGELQLMGEWDRFLAHGRAGVYRNGSIREGAIGGLVGYTGEAAVDWKVTKEWRIGVAALRDARLNDPTVGQLADRDVVQLRLTWERARFE